MSFFHYPYTHTHTHTHIFLFQEAFNHNHLRCYPSKDRLIRSKRITLLLVEDPCPPLSRGYVKPEGSCVLSHWPPLKAGLCVAHWIESVPPVMWALRCERDSILFQAEEQAGWSHHPASQGADFLGSSVEAEPAGPLVPKAGHCSPLAERMSGRKVIGSSWQKRDTNLNRGDGMTPQRKLFWEQFWERRALTTTQTVQLLGFCNIWEDLNMVWICLIWKLAKCCKGSHDGKPPAFVPIM